MSKRTLVKGISILMSFVLLVLAFPLNVFADNADDVNITQPEEQQNFSLPINEDTNGLTATSTSGATFIKPGDKTIAELQEMTFDAESMPEFVNMEVAEEKEHVHRLTAQESSLSTVAYQNRDGSKSVYIFSKPVKYVDSEGNIKDKSSKISSVIDDTYSYAMLDNNIKVYFPKNVINGTYLTVGDYNIKMSPKTTESSSPTYGSDGKVIYNGAFGRNTMLVYETKLNGVKEDIVLVKNTGINEFEFELETRLVPALTNGVWYLANESGARIASFGDIIIKDSAGNQILGNMAVTSSDTVGKYNVTITAPSDFLNADTTVYPVYIDPSVYIYANTSYEDTFGNYTYNSILDVGIYETEYLKEYADSTPDRHYFSKDYEEGKIIYKFYDFYGKLGGYKELNLYQIASAKLYFFAEQGVAPSTITARPMNATWDIKEYGRNPEIIFDPMLWNSYSMLSQSTATRWRFVCTGNGYYKLIPENATSGYVLSLASSNAGNCDNLTSKLYVNDSSYIDEWAIILPMSEYELDYDTSLWDGIIEEETNCYAYAINNQISSPGVIFEKQQPGLYAFDAGVSIPQIDTSTLTLSEFMGINTKILAELDFEQFSEDQNMQYIFQSVGKYEICPAGSYKVMLIAGGSDYHWYRQNSDGTWSHKPGTDSVTKLDDSYNIIYDPILSDWRESYDLFIGYFAVTPWNQYYN